MPSLLSRDEMITNCETGAGSCARPQRTKRLQRARGIRSGNTAGAVRAARVRAIRQRREARRHASVSAVAKLLLRLGRLCTNASRSKIRPRACLRRRQRTRRQGRRPGSGQGSSRQASNRRHEEALLREYRWERRQVITQAFLARSRPACHALRRPRRVRRNPLQRYRYRRLQARQPDRRASTADGGPFVEVLHDDLRLNRTSSRSTSVSARRRDSDRQISGLSPPLQL